MKNMLSIKKLYDGMNSESRKAFVIFLSGYLFSVLFLVLLFAFIKYLEVSQQKNLGANTILIGICLILASAQSAINCMSKMKK
jgi:hypothetical protein